MPYADPEKKKAQRHRWNLQRRYGVTVEEYERLAKDGCAICGGRQEAGKRRLHVDHCHTTGRVRGVLCVNCNQALGKFKDDPALLRKAADYLG